MISSLGFLMYDATRAEDKSGRQYHIQLKPGDIPRYVLLPGDPGRVPKIASLREESREVARNREYVTRVGKYKGVDIAATSTGVGPSNVEIVLVELSRVGADTLIRVGSSGAIHKDIPVGSVIITYASHRLDGVSFKRAPEGYPAVASLSVTLALIQAAESLGVEYYIGLTAGSDSFYLGQERPVNGYLPRRLSGLIEELRALKVLNFEMETSALFTIARILGLRAGAVEAVFANRVTGEFEKKGELEAAKVANEAVRILHERDESGKIEFSGPLRLP